MDLTENRFEMILPLIIRALKNSGGGTGGTTNYNDLTNKPQINGVTLEENKSGEKQEAYYEYDYNEISGPFDKIPVDDIQAHPEQYLNYEYTENKTDVDSLIKRIEKLEQENADMNRIFEGVVNSESGIL